MLFRSFFYTYEVILVRNVDGWILVVSLTRNFAILVLSIGGRRTRELVGRASGASSESSPENNDPAEENNDPLEE